MWPECHMIRADCNHIWQECHMSQHLARLATATCGKHAKGDSNLNLHIREFQTVLHKGVCGALAMVD